MPGVLDQNIIEFCDHLINAVHLLYLPPGSPSSQTVHRTLLLEETGCRQSGTVEHENKLEVNFYSTTQYTACKAEYTSV